MNPSQIPETAMPTPRDELLSDAPTAAAEPRAFEGDDVPAREGNPTGARETTSLLSPDETVQLRGAWQDVQGRFVDAPRTAVEDANQLVTRAMERLADLFTEERGRLEAQWDRGGDVSTEDLRLALQRYRAFFDRLLSV
jgi:hypothetical protein